MGDCSYSFDSPEIWDCDACNRSAPRWNAGHSGIPGECRWEELGVRQSAPCAGAHPREPRRKAQMSSSAGLPGTSAEGELGADMEEEALKHLD